MYTKKIVLAVHFGVEKTSLMILSLKNSKSRI